MVTLRSLYTMETSQSPLETMNHLQDFGLIAQSRICSVCDTPMFLHSSKRSSEKYIWRCRKCLSVMSVRAGSWFAQSRMSIHKILQLTYMWCHRQHQMFVRHELSISAHTTVAWYNFCREVCVEIILQHREQIGGPGTIVEVDESKFGKQRHRGNIVEGQWMLGGIQRGSNRCFLVNIQDRSPETLIPLIKEFIAPGTTIVSDCWKDYNSLGQEGYRDLTVNHSLTFKNADTGASTNAVHGMWANVKRQLPDCHRTKGMFSSYLGEFMYRQLRKDVPCIYTTFLQDIGKVYTPTSQTSSVEEVDS